MYDNALRTDSAQHSRERLVPLIGVAVRNFVVCNVLNQPILFSAGVILGLLSAELTIV